jgi:hypothetical protein
MKTASETNSEITVTHTPTPWRPYYSRALNALEAAHKACFENETRPALGMSHGPFSGVNEALGIVDELERKQSAMLELLEDVGNYLTDLDGHSHTSGPLISRIDTVIKGIKE